MSIRDLELAVIKAAIEAKWRKTAGADDALLGATEALIFGCPECNAGGHTCPGDGNPIPHGAGDCGEHDEPAAAPEWIASTFLHIEQGDRLRIGQEEATAVMVSKLTWHVHNRSAWEHVQIRADVGFGPVPFPSGTAVEILCDAERKAQLIMSEAGLKPRRVDSDA